MRALLSRAAAYNALGQLDLAIEDYGYALSLDSPATVRSPRSPRFQASLSTSEKDTTLTHLNENSIDMSMSQSPLQHGSSPMWK